MEYSPSIQRRLVIKIWGADHNALLSLLINSAILNHDQKLASAISQNTRGMLKIIGRTWLIIAGVSFLLICTSGSILWWQGQKLLDNQLAIQEQSDALTKLNARTWGVQFQSGENGRRFLIMSAGTKLEVIPYNGTMWIELKQD
ncbi:TPA: hypothetical protein ACXHW4_004724 [Enterobacter hormaechei]